MKTDKEILLELENLIQLRGLRFIVDCLAHICLTQAKIYRTTKQADIHQLRQASKLEVDALVLRNTLLESDQNV